MGRVWVLDTDTKGTGAEMVPLDTLLERKRSGPGADPGAAKRRRRAARRRDRAHADGSHRDAGPEAQPRPAREFRLVNALSGRLIGDSVDLRTACELVGAARSVADVRVYARASTDEPWRALTLREQRTLRALRQS